jgi:transposase
LIRQWEQEGIVGLQDRSRSGCPLSLNEEEVALFRSYIDENPHQLKGAVSQFEEKTGKKLSLDTYKRVLKKKIIFGKDVEGH